MPMKLSLMKACNKDKNVNAENGTDHFIQAILSLT